MMRGKVDVFSIDTLVNMLAAAEIRLEMRLIRKHLAQSITRNQA